jgi:glucosamine--fructose-6-phosphate aminotransferase (isomerizing)
MCGIIGLIGTNSQEKIINGLVNMEYRGYDSCGMAFLKNNKINIIKKLESPNTLKIEDSFEIGIGHTRWATHGEVNLKNAHPILSYDDNLAIVHNGVIENYKELKDKYLSDISFMTETDTEVLINLIALFYKEKSLLDSISEVVKIIKGSYAFLILDKIDKNSLYLACDNMPLIIGKSDKNLIVASDILAFDKEINKIYRLPNNYIGKINNIENLIFDFIDFNYQENIAKKENKHHMYDEIHYSLDVIKELYNTYFFNNVEIKKIQKLFKKKKSVTFIASGSSYNAAMVAQYFLNKNCKIKTNVYLSSEFIYNEYPKSDIYFIVSQSGETADTIKALNKIDKNSLTISLTNVKTSTIAKKTKINFDMLCKKEISVASTKAFTSSIFFFYALFNENIKYRDIIESIKEVFKDEKIIYELALKTKDYNNLFFLGRGLDGIINLENILKIKEVSYLFVESYFGGELKHGPLALIDKNSYVFITNTNPKTDDIMRTNIAEVLTRGGNCITFSSIKNKDSLDTYSFIIDGDEAIFPCAIFFQLFAYFLSIIKGINPDRPKNLAKSVTVE